MTCLMVALSAPGSSLRATASMSSGVFLGARRLSLAPPPKLPVVPPDLAGRPLHAVQELRRSHQGNWQRGIAKRGVDPIQHLRPGFMRGSWLKKKCASSITGIKRDTRNTSFTLACISETLRRIAWPTPNALELPDLSGLGARAVQADKPSHAQMAVAPGADRFRFPAPLKPIEHDHGPALERVIKLFPDLPADGCQAKLCLYLLFVAALVFHQRANDSLK